MKKIYLILLLISGVNSFSQTLDSVNYTYDHVNQELTGYIEGHFFWGTTTKDIVNITDSIYGDTILIEVHYVPCQLWNLHTFYDTTFIQNVNIQQGQKTVETISIMDVNLDSTSCYFNPSEIFVDTAFFNINVPIGIEEYLGNLTRIFPNPVNSSFSIDIPLRIKKLTIYDHCGRYISSLETNDESHDISDLKAGIYFLEIETNEGTIRRKII